jgi:tetratricopeptide (TPR) repeat protein
VDRGVIATASELFEARHYPSVVAVCSDALNDEPVCLPLLLLRARAHIALRRDVAAQADLRDAIRVDPECSLAFRLLGELAARRDEYESAAVFFRETLRLDPGDRSAHDWLQIVDAVARPAPRASDRGAAQVEPPRLARGTQQPAPPQAEERQTRPFARGSEREPQAWAPRPAPEPAPAPIEKATLTGRPPTQAPASAAPKAAPRSAARPSTPELPGFDEFLVTSGILSRERLRAAQAYQRSMRVQLSTAIVTLGLASPQRMAYASVAHQSQLARDRQP